MNRSNLSNERKHAYTTIDQPWDIGLNQNIIWPWKEISFAFVEIMKGHDKEITYRRSFCRCLPISFIVSTWMPWNAHDVSMVSGTRSTVVAAFVSFEWAILMSQEANDIKHASMTHAFIEMATIYSYLSIEIERDDDGLTRITLLCMHIDIYINTCVGWQCRISQYVVSKYTPSKRLRGWQDMSVSWYPVKTQVNMDDHYQLYLWLPFELLTSFAHLDSSRWMGAGLHVAARKVPKYVSTPCLDHSENPLWWWWWWRQWWCLLIRYDMVVAPWHIYIYLYIYIYI